MRWAGSVLSDNPGLLAGADKHRDKYISSISNMPRNYSEGAQVKRLRTASPRPRPPSNNESRGRPASLRWRRAARVMITAVHMYTPPSTSPHNLHVYMEQAYHAKQSVLKYESPRGNRERTAKERKTNQMAFGVLPPQTPKPCRSFLKKDHAASIGSRRVVGERELLPLRDCFNIRI